MSITDQNPLHSQILDAARKIVDNHPEAKPVSGDNYTEPVFGLTVFYTRTLPLDPGRLEINLTTPEARPTFEWLAEITVDDKAAGTYKHFLLRPEDLVEAYGKNISPVSEDTAQELLSTLQQA